jgi:hypothetical protein
MIPHWRRQMTTVTADIPGFLNAFQLEEVARIQGVMS